MHKELKNLNDMLSFLSIGLINGKLYHEAMFKLINNNYGQIWSKHEKMRNRMLELTSDRVLKNLKFDYYF